MRKVPALATITIAASIGSASAQSSLALDALVAKGTAYVTSYEKAFALLVSEEHYVQEISRPVSAGSNLSRTKIGITVTFRRDPEVEIWVPAQMDEYYKEQGSSNEIFATATYVNVRKFQVNTNERLTKPPGLLQ